MAASIATIPDDALFKYADRVKGKVVIITGAASGFGRVSSLQFAKHGAKIVAGDVNLKGVEALVGDIKKAGGQAVGVKCDVTSWDDQVAMFETAVKTFGQVHVVIPNAGVNEIGNLEEVSFDKNGKPLPPNMKTLDINLTGVLYTVNLGIHYLRQNPVKGDLCSIVLLGSMASWQSPQGGSVYAATKHAVLGLMRALYPSVRRDGIRMGTIHPWFADTGITEGSNAAWRDLLAALPKVPVERVGGAIFRCATDPDPATNGSVWMLPDDKPLLVLEREALREGVYKQLELHMKKRLKEGTFKLSDYNMSEPKAKL